MTVIISYRRDDTGAITGRICDRLRARFGVERVYMDIDSNPLGVDYRSHIDESLKRCDLLLAVIGSDWLGTGDIGARRIDDPSDLVRLEVTRALARGIRVVPLLIDDTEMPSTEELPEDLRSLKFRQAFRVDSGVDFHHHLDRLCAEIAAAAQGPAEAIEAQAPPLPTSRKPNEPMEKGEPRPYKPVPALGRKSEKMPVSGLAIAAFICSLLGFVFVPITLPAIICGHLARRQIRRNPSLSGNGLATTALVLGYVWLLIIIVYIIARTQAPE